MKTVLITGANSYIGTSFEAYVHKHYADQLSITTIDMIDGSWRSTPFTTTDPETGEQRPYDIIFHVAGLAHADVGHVDEETKKRYYAVNTDLAIETATKAKADGCSQFVFMSSMIVYGKQTHITASTRPHPSNFYGDSKWKADKGVRKLASPRSSDSTGDSERGGQKNSEQKFTVTVLRPPMIYGRGSKGNYPTLSKLARKVPVFPSYQNKRSMLYIENLCEFLAQVMIKGLGGVYFPQNREYSSTSDIVRNISKVAGRKVIITMALNPAVEIAKKCPIRKIRELASKAFGDAWYEQDMSTYEGLDYQKVNLKTSIRRTER